MLILTILISINVIGVLGYLLYTANLQLKGYGNFKPFHFTIGTPHEYTAAHEKFLIQHKTVLETYKRYIDINLSTIPDQMATPSLSDAEIRRLQGKFQAYLEISR